MGVGAFETSLGPILITFQGIYDHKLFFILKLLNEASGICLLFMRGIGDRVGSAVTIA